MKRTAISLLTLTLVICAIAMPAGAQETGRTDGSEGSEYGKGGNPFGSPAGRFFLSASFGSGFFDLQGTGNKTGFLYGFDLGYEMDEWIGLQAGYSYLSDRDLSIFSLGSNLSYPWNPFVYSLTIHASIYAPDAGDRHFGLAPGAGIDIVVHDRVRIGLNYKHDFIFTDNRTTDMDRVYAGLKFCF